MKIGIPVANFHEGNPGQYVQRALTSMGHQAAVLSQYEFYTAFRENQFDFYLCVDSGGPLNLFESSIADCDFSKVAFWMIDFRRGKTLKNPNDADTCRYLGNKGGWVFQAQNQDVTDCINSGVTNRVSWLPLAADEEIWNSEPKENILYDVGFVGNIWCGPRAEVLNFLGHSFKLSPNGAWGTDAAKVLRQSKIAFNISSFYGESVAFDVNMRVWESLSCSCPLLTNYTPSLPLLFNGSIPPYIKTYSSISGIVPTVVSALADPEFLASGKQARGWILANGTYKIRMQQALDELRKQGMV